MENDTHLTDNNGEQPRDNFYHGVISKIFWSNETGVIHSDSGKEVPFIFAFVTLLGAPRQDINFLRPGMRVGFDVGWTSKGLRASTIKIYDLYQDDVSLEDNGRLAALPEHVTADDHPISRYRPQEMREAAEPPRYRQRRQWSKAQGQGEDQTRPEQRPPRRGPERPQALRREQEQPQGELRSQAPEDKRQESAQRGQERRRPEARGQGTEQGRFDRRSEARGQGTEQNRFDARARGQERTRPDSRFQGQEQRRQERPQGQRRDDAPRPPVRATATPANNEPQDSTTPSAEDRSRRSRRRRGRR